LKSISLKLILDAVITACRRFPLVVLCSIIGTVAAILVIDRGVDTGLYPNIIITASLGLALFLAIDIAGDRYKLPSSSRGIGYLAAAAILGIFYFSLPEAGASWPTTHIVRFSVLSVAFHLLVAFAPFLHKDASINGFWQYNKTLFLRFVTAALFSWVLYLGLTLALAAIQNLFSIDISSESYGRLFILIAGIFNTLFFLAGVPDSFEELEQDDVHPRGLRIFGQFILLPLASTYLVILYGYGVRILTNPELLKGWVGYLIIAFSVVAALTWLFLYPYSKKQEFSWMSKVWRGFNIAMIPLIVLLFVALFQRISNYGLTEMRYLGILVGICITVFAVYFLLSNKKDIRIIPMLLCATGLLSTFGFWGSSSLAESNQLSRFENTLLTQDMLVDGKIEKIANPLPFEARKKLSGQVEYLVQHYGYNTLKSLYATDLDTLLADDKSTYSHTNRLVKELGFDYVGRWMTDNGVRYYYSPVQGEVEHITDYDLLLSMSYFYASNDTINKVQLIDGDSLTRVHNPEGLRISYIWDRFPTDSVHLDFTHAIAIADSLQQVQGAEKLFVYGKGKSWSIRANINTLGYKDDAAEIYLDQAVYKLFIDTDNNAPAR